MRFRKFAVDSPEAGQRFKAGLRNASLSFFSSSCGTQIDVLETPFSEHRINAIALEAGVTEVVSA